MALVDPAYKLALDYDVTYERLDYNGIQRVRSIKIPITRKKLRNLGFKNCFEDASKIREKCGCCLSEIQSNKCHFFKHIQGLSIHLVGNTHKDRNSLNEILDALRTIEILSLQNQGFDFELLEKIEEMN